MADAFISHAADDERKAIELATRLESARVSCWYFERDNVAGEQHLATSQREISHSKAFIVLVSRSSVESDFVYPELLHAMACQRRIIPVFLDMNYVELSSCRPKWATAIGFHTGVNWTDSDQVACKVVDGIERNRKGSSEPGGDSVEAIADTGENGVFRHRKLPLLTNINLWKWSRLLHPGQGVRFVASAFLRIFDRGRYYLLRNLHRPEQVGPIGGVIKYHGDARSTLNNLGFRPHVFGNASEMEQDLRGFVPARQCHSLISWYLSGREREAAEDCLRREFTEECCEAGIESGVDALKGCRFNFIRTVFDGPEGIEGKDYWQFRIFEIYDLDHELPPAGDQIAILRDSASQNSNIVGATMGEIRAGRTENGTIVGSVAAFLIGRTRSRQTDLPLYENSPQ